MLLGLVPRVCIKGGRRPSQTQKHVPKQTCSFLEHEVLWAHVAKTCFPRQYVFLNKGGLVGPCSKNVFWGENMFLVHGLCSKQIISFKNTFGEKYTFGKRTHGTPCSETRKVRDFLRNNICLRECQSRGAFYRPDPRSMIIFVFWVCVFENVYSPKFYKSQHVRMRLILQWFFHFRMQS